MYSIKISIITTIRTFSECVGEPHIAVVRSLLSAGEVCGGQELISPRIGKPGFGGCSHQSNQRLYGKFAFVSLFILRCIYLR